MRIHPAHHCVVGVVYLEAFRRIRMDSRARSALAGFRKHSAQLLRAISPSEETDGKLGAMDLCECVGNPHLLGERRADLRVAVCDFSLPRDLWIRSLAAEHAHPMNQKLTKRIVITGPESSGKSSLAAWLVQKFEVPMATEYARIHLEAFGAKYEESTVIAMAQQHLIHQQEMVPMDAPIGIFDTDLLNYKIWCDIAFSHCDASILRGIEQESHHVYLLCYPDLPWVADPLREHPHERLMLYERHLAEIRKTGREYIVIRGEGEQRKDAAREAMRKLIGF